MSATWPADLVFGFTVVEGAVLLAVRRRAGWAVSPQQIVLALAPGLALVAALRAALGGGGIGPIALALLAAGALHLGDMILRLGKPTPAGRGQAADGGYAPEPRQGCADGSSTRGR